MKSYPCPSVIALPLTPQRVYRWLLLPLMFLAWSLTSHSQELVFKNSTLQSGKDGKDGAVYKFSSVSNNIDALVKINGRSSSLVKLVTIDLSSQGFDRAFQPQITYNDGSAPGAASWWMEFEISFVKAGTATPVDISSFDLTALDVDGNGDKLHEYVSFYNLQSYTLESGSLLDVSNILEPILGLLGLAGKKFDGPVKNFSNIDTSSTQVMTSAKYTNTNKFRVRSGAVTTGKSSSADRMYSYWFKSFNYQAALLGTLPVKMSYFRAVREDDKQVILNWGTEQEKNTSHFVIERSFNGSDFSQVGMIFTSGNSETPRTYTFTDNLKTVNKMIYYRLRIVDLDSRAEVSTVRIVRNDVKTETATILTYPNPAQNEVRVTLPQSWQEKPVRIDLYSINGNVVKHTVNAKSGQTEILDLSTVTPGIYVVKVFNGEETVVQRIVKSK